MNLLEERLDNNRDILNKVDHALEKEDINVEEEWELWNEAATEIYKKAFRWLVDTERVSEVGAERAMKMLKVKTEKENSQLQGKNPGK